MTEEAQSSQELYSQKQQEALPKYSGEKLTHLRQIFPQENADSLYNIGITAVHGNEPYLISASISTRINDILAANGLRRTSIVLPSLYGERMRKIMLEEFPEHPDEIYISEELGTILKQTEFSRAGYQAHLRSVVENQPKTSDDLLNFLSRPFSATSLNGQHKEFLPQYRRLEINAGANVTASEKKNRKTHFFFPVLLSELMEHTSRDPMVRGRFDSATLDRVKRYAEEIEERYLTTQVPYVSTLSAESSYDSKGKILTPALKSARQSPSVFVKSRKGIYVMASGNEIGREALEDQAKQLSKQGYDILSPAWLQLDFGKKEIPDVIFNPDVRAVIGRAGWGIMWMAQVAEKPFIALPHLWFDNPEIHFNIRAIQDYGLGIEFSAEEKMIEAVQVGKTAAENIRKLNQNIYKELKLPEGIDGITVAAQNILTAEINKLSESSQI